MGKKLSQASTKITKNNNHNNDHKKQQQLNSLIKVLQPKVYITDSASFKNLVQELTGNGNIPLVSSSPPLFHDDRFNPSPVIEIEDEITNYTVYNSSYEQQSSGEFSSLASSSELSVPTNSFSQSLDYYCSPEELGYQQPTTTFNEFGSSLENIDHLTQYRNVESWLLEMDPFVNSNYEHGYVPLNIPPEASSIYDYELTGMIM